MNLRVKARCAYSVDHFSCAYLLDGEGLCPLIDLPTRVAGMRPTNALFDTGSDMNVTMGR